MSTLNVAQIVDSLVSILNIAVGLAGLAFVIMVIIAGIKYALAQGDPKGLEGAKQTLTYAFFGLFVVIGSFTIINIVAQAFGVDPSITKDPSGKSKSAIEELILLIQSN